MSGFCRSVSCKRAFSSGNGRRLNAAAPADTLRARLTKVLLWMSSCIHFFTERSRGDLKLHRMNCHVDRCLLLRESFFSVVRQAEGLLLAPGLIPLGN